MEKQGTKEKKKEMVYNRQSSFVLLLHKNKQQE
jgi:hypothetical protein